jgi:hypothetical protein
MTTTFLHYPLSDGFIHNWLVAGPLLYPVPNPGLAGPDAAQRILQRYYEPESGVDESPVDLAPLGPLTKDYPLLTWRYSACREDHFVTATSAAPTWSYLRAWAYAQVTVATAQEARLNLTTFGPADVWLNGVHIHRQAELDPARPHTTPVPGTLAAGTNELLVRFESAGFKDIVCDMALKIEGLVGDAEVMLPTSIEPTFIEKRVVLEKLAARPTLDRYVYGYLDGDRLNQNEPMVVTFPGDLEVGGTLIMRVQSLQGDIFQERTQPAKPGLVVEMAKKFPLRNGPHHLALWPPLDDYYERQLRFERKELFYVVRTPYTLKAGPSAEQRAQEALEDAAERRTNSLYCELAKMALGQWERVDRKIVDHAVQGIHQAQAGSLTDLLGLLGALLRFRKKSQDLQTLGLSAGAFVTDFPQWRNEQNGGSWPGAEDSGNESGQILYLTCEVLAGQLFPDRVFEASGQKGRWHRNRAVVLAIAALRQHGRYGFQDWNSPLAVETILAALSHLADLASSDTLRDLASVLMDKIFFDMAINSFQGAFGASKGRADLASVLSARLEPTSGIARLMWGLGNLNENLIGTVSLASCRKYELPEVIRQIATSPVDAFWSRERQAAPAQSDPTMPGAGHPQGWEVVTASYKTKDFMLSSAQSYQAGQPGTNEHIWQATLGPDALVFVNHPLNMSEDDSHQPNVWVGNGVLPRVAQWGDVLIALHQLPADDWLGFTHAYFPAAAFDETALSGQWAFARKGEAYVALMAARGLEFVTHGQTAFRELRSYGLENVWVCHMGQAILDGSFADFQSKILAMAVSAEHLAVGIKTLRGDTLAFAWEGALRVNGQEQPLDPARHIENPYCIVDLPAAQIDIVYQEQGVRLKFE